MRMDLETGDGVYAPREDSGLLAETASGYGGDRLLDMGTGTGYVAAGLSADFEEVVAVDVDPRAVECAEKNLPGAEVRESDLFEAVDGVFDLITFNPPYLPSEGPLDGERAWNGGADGRRVVNRFVEGLPPHLARDGCCLLLVSSLTGIEEVEGLSRDAGFDVGVVARKELFFEELVVLEITPGPQGSSPRRGPS